MEINYTLNTEKYKTLRYTDHLPHILRKFESEFSMLDILEIEISECPRSMLSNYKQASNRHNAQNRTCRLKISIYPGTDPSGFYRAVETSIEQLKLALETTPAV